MPGMNGLEMLPKAKAIRPDVPVIIITAYGDENTQEDSSCDRTFLISRPISLAHCSVISNWTGRPVFLWTIVARCRTFVQSRHRLPAVSPSHRHKAAIDRYVNDRKGVDPAISRRTRMDQTCFGSRSIFWPTSNPLFQGCGRSLPTGVGIQFLRHPALRVGL